MIQLTMQKEIIQMKKGFTLAEVLITLGIIGVVAAMTLPTLINNTNKKEMVTKLQKEYSVLSQALLLAENENGLAGTWGFRDGSTAQVLQIYDYLSPHLNIIKYCGVDYKGDSTQNKGVGCFDSNWLGLNGSIPTNWTRTAYGLGGNVVNFVLADGTVISIDGHNQPGDKDLLGINDEHVANEFAVITVDLNGKKKPNSLGRDIFLFILGYDRIIPAGADDYSSCSKTSLGYTCAQKVLNEEKFNY